MLTVRFPSGVSVTYNSASFLHYGPGQWELYTASKDKGGTWVCSIQVSAAMNQGTLVDAPSWLLRDLKKKAQEIQCAEGRMAGMTEAW